MTRQLINTARLPDSPGVYLFLGKNRKILYIGKATSLRDRVRSYFRNDLIDTRGPRIAGMIGKIKSVDYRKTDSVLEAMLMEADLIKKFKPKYNTAEKDDKSFNCVVVTAENFPRILVARSRDIKSRFIYLNNRRYSIKFVFGPFPEGLKLKEALKIIRKIFPFRDYCEPGSGKPCFNRQIGLCPGVCTGEISETEYAKTIRNIRLLFEGKKKSIMTGLKKDMSSYAKRLEFEKAGSVKKTLAALSNIRDVALISENRRANFGRSTQPFRIEAYDIAHTAGRETVGVMTVVENNKINKNQYRLFKVKEETRSNDISALKEILTRRLRHEEWPLPNIIVVDGGTGQLNAAKKIVAGAFLNSYDIIPVIAVTKNEFHRPKEILGDKILAGKYENAILLSNAEAHRFAVAFHRKRRDKIV